MFNKFLFQGFTLVGLLALSACFGENKSAVRTVAGQEPEFPTKFDLPLRKDLGEEYVDNEENAIKDLFGMMSKHMVKNAPVGNGTAYRAVHAKGHGCVKASFEVLDAIDPHFKAGVFTVPHKYDALIRFSNGDGPPENDDSLESRGMAIKLLNVEGKKIIDEVDPYQSQDFLMADQPKFFVSNVNAYAVAIHAKEGGIFAKGFFVGLFHSDYDYRKKATPILNPMNARYWSKLPYQLGNEVVKFSSRPCVVIPMLSPPVGVANYMKDEMRKQLKSGESCFDFMLQRRIDGPTKNVDMPIEDASVEWKEEQSKFQKVAEIRVPQGQDIDSKESTDFCENLSFNPWHALEEERPLGNLNRVRKIVYEVSSRTRHRQNHTGN